MGRLSDFPRGGLIFVAAASVALGLLLKGKCTWKTAKSRLPTRVGRLKSSYFELVQEKRNLATATAHVCKKGQTDFSNAQQGRAVYFNLGAVFKLTPSDFQAKSLLKIYGSDAEFYETDAGLLWDLQTDEKITTPDGQLIVQASDKEQVFVMAPSGIDEVLEKLVMDKVVTSPLELLATVWHLCAALSVDEEAAMPTIDPTKMEELYSKVMPTLHSTTPMPPVSADTLNKVRAALKGYEEEPFAVLVLDKAVKAS